MKYLYVHHMRKHYVQMSTEENAYLKPTVLCLRLEQPSLRSLSKTYARLAALFFTNVAANSERSDPRAAAIYVSFDTLAGGAPFSNST